MLTRAEFLKTTDLKREAVEVDGLGTVLMREMSYGERLKLAESMEGMKEEDQAVIFVAVALCEPDGSPMFGPDELDEAAEQIKAKPVRTIETLQAAFLRLNGISQEAIEEAAGNSIAIRNGTGSSGSPETSDTPQPEPSLVS